MYVLYCSQPPGGDHNALASLLGSSDVFNPPPPPIQPVDAVVYFSQPSDTARLRKMLIAWSVQLCTCFLCPLCGTGEHTLHALCCCTSRVEHAMNIPCKPKVNKHKGYFQWPVGGTMTVTEYEWFDKINTLRCTSVRRTTKNDRHHLWEKGIWFVDRHFLVWSMSHPLTWKRPGLWQILQPATRGWQISFGFTLGVAVMLSLYSVSNLS